MGIDISIFEGVSKKSGLPYKALKVSIGKWEKLIFVTDFELQYIAEILQENQSK